MEAMEFLNLHDDNLCFGRRKRHNWSSYFCKMWKQHQFSQAIKSSSSLKWRFYYFSAMVKATYQEVIGIEKIVCYSQFPRERGFAHHSGPCRKAPELVRRQRNWKENIGKSPLLWFLLSETGKARMGRFRIG